MVRVSTLEVEAFRSPLTVNPEAKVEDACTRIPAEVLVGVMVDNPSVSFCQAPFCPRVLASVPQASSPEELVSMVSQDTRLSSVTAPEANRVPTSLVLPTTPRDVVGTLVPIPTFPSPPLMTKAGLAN